MVVVTPDLAATVIVMRPAHPNFEVLMVERVSRGFFGGLHVFPGGRVDEVDRSVLARSLINASDDDQDHRSAALRELCEETGLLVSAGGVMSAPSLRDAALYEWARDAGATLAGDSLVLVSRWVTPETAPRRFDTRFYLLGVSDVPDVRTDPAELVAHSWIQPGEALERERAGKWKMFLPTIAHLRWLERRSSIDEALDSARGADGRTLIEPRRVEDGSIVPVHLPAEERV